jgi:hypothetical protein
MPFTKEQLKAYYEANRLKLNQQRTERRRLARLGQINNSKVETSDRRLRQVNHSEVETIKRLGQVETIPNLEIGLRQVETMSKVETPTDKFKVETISQIKSQPEKEVETVVDRVQSESKIVVDLEAYNTEVYKRASVLTKDPAAFFTFPDGRKIIRTVCGCNPTTKDFYTWCLDACQYFTSWRNSQKPCEY